MNRDSLPGKQWLVERSGYCFKVTIENGNAYYVLGDVLEAVSRLPLSYMPGLEIVSGRDENGLALYKYMGPGVLGHGSRTYCNIVTLNLGLVIHELNHAMEQEARSRWDASLLERWKEDAMEVDPTYVSRYGKLGGVAEDMAEFGKVYAVCLQRNRLEELQQRSPSRFVIWNNTLTVVNTALRNTVCDDFAAPSNGTDSTNRAIEAPLDEYLPDTIEVAF